MDSNRTTEELEIMCVHRFLFFACWVLVGLLVIGCAESNSVAPDAGIDSGSSTDDPLNSDSTDSLCEEDTAEESDSATDSAYDSDTESASETDTFVGKPCLYEGVWYEHGDKWKCSNGCNSCECVDGEVLATLILC